MLIKMGDPTKTIQRGGSIQSKCWGIGLWPPPAPHLLCILQYKGWNRTWTLGLFSYESCVLIPPLCPVEHSIILLQVGLFQQEGWGSTYWEQPAGSAQGTLQAACLGAFPSGKDGNFNSASLTAYVNFSTAGPFGGRRKVEMPSVLSASCLCLHMLEISAELGHSQQYMTAQWKPEELIWNQTPAVAACL